MNRRDHDNEEAVQEKAIALLTRRDAGWSPEDAAEFALWRAADPRHEAAVRRIESTQRLLARLPESPAAAAMLDEVEELYAARRRVTPIGPWLKAAGALAAAACVALATWTFASRPQPHSTVSFTTVTGQHRTVDLTDGSILLLNSGTEVDVEYVADERRVNLRRGEVHFSVAKDEARPFIVAAGSIKVRAVGTAFNVKRDHAAIEVIVTEGKVRVSRDDVPAAAGASTAPLFLVAGESAVIGTIASEPLPSAGRLAPEVLREKLRWQAPRLEFFNTPLSEVVVRFNRYSRVQLEIGDAELAARPVGGTFNADNAEAFVNLLLATGDVRVERISETHIVLRKAR
jgi:transmembrane sensor